MNRRQHAHRRSTEENILKVMQENPGVWMTSNEIACRMKFSQTRGVAKRLDFLRAETAGIEMCIEKSSHYRLFRYQPAGEPSAEPEVREQPGDATGNESGNGEPADKPGK